MSRAYVSTAVRREIAERDRHRCAYCLSSEVLSGISLAIDHIVPVSAEGNSEPDNLCLACRSCNEFKGNQQVALDPISGELVSLFNPRQQLWSDHFRWQDEGVRVEGQTAVGRATVEALKLNNSLIVKSRARWVQVGWHPPRD